MQENILVISSKQFLRIAPKKGAINASATDDDPCILLLKISDVSTESHHAIRSGGRTKGQHKGHVQPQEKRHRILVNLLKQGKWALQEL